MMQSRTGTLMYITTRIYSQHIVSYWQSIVSSYVHVLGWLGLVPREKSMTRSSIPEGEDLFGLGGMK
jgi:hypothetical protein